MEIPYYLKIGHAGDLESKEERIVYRLLEIMPGFLIWLTFSGMVLASFFWPKGAAIFIISFCFYWILRTFHYSFHLVAAYRKMRENLEIDWLDELNKLPAWRGIYHLVVLPMYKEGLEIVMGTMEALVNSDYPKDKMIVALAIEERAGRGAKEIAEIVSREFGGKFYRFLVTCHPQNITGEIAGKGSNETWAGRQVKEKIIDPLAIPYENVIVSCFDIDTRVYPRYFSCLSFHYLTVKGAERASFQPIPLYLNNVWQAPFFSRVVAFSNFFWQALQQQRPEKIITYSSHSMSFKALVEMDFWQTNVVSEDAGIFWKAFLFYGGDYQTIPFHYPVSMDCVLSRGIKETAINQYKQQRRWAFGSEGIPYLLFGFLKNKKIPFEKKFRYGFLTIEGFWAWGTNSFLILLLGWLPLVLGGEHFTGTSLAYNLPALTRNMMTVALAGLFICVAISLKTIFLAPNPPRRPRKLVMLAQWLFFPVGLIIFGSIPSIDAQTRLMLGKYLGFSVTEKTRKI
ncbi:MAG: hypothetical protein V1705_02335 [bacterium]